jgi:hypothetical protein
MPTTTEPKKVEPTSAPKAEEKAKVFDVVASNAPTV